MDGEQNLKLSRDEALVLFEFLSREIDDHEGDNLKSAFLHDAEFWVLNGILCLLERKLVAPFMEDYGEQVSEAREEVLRENGGTYFDESSE